MGRIRRNKLLRYILYTMLLLLACSQAVPAEEENAIEQVYVNMPEITVYYRTDIQAKDPKAILEGETLDFVESEIFSETGEGTVYYILVDISGSMKQSRFSDIRTSLTEFVKTKGASDTVKLYSFGDTVTEILSGEENDDRASEAIDGLEAHDQNTVLFDAITEAADRIRSDDEKEHKRRIMVVVSDGKDCADDTKTTESVKKKLVERQIPVFTYAVENNENDPEETIRIYRSQFSTLASDTGGIPWTPAGDTDSVLTGLQKMQETIGNTRRGKYTASTNRVSNSEETFILDFGNGITDKRSVIVAKNIPDEEAPEVTGITVEESNSLRVAFSEKVENGRDTGNYQIIHAGKNIAVTQVIFVSEDPYTYELVLDQELTNGEYEIRFRNITDISNEKNSLSTEQKTFTVSGMPEATETPAPTGKADEEASDSDSASSSSAKAGNEAATAEDETDESGETEDNTEAIKEDAEEGSTEEKSTDTEEAAGDGDDAKETFDEDNGETVDEETAEETDEETGLTTYIADHWPIIAAAAAIIIVLIVFFITGRKKKVIPAVAENSGTDIELHNMNTNKVHIKNTVSNDAKRLTIWISNSSNEPQKLVREIKGSLIIGRRQSQCDIFCDDDSISKQHFALNLEDSGKITVTDLDSTNGTFINGKKVTEPVVVKNNDEITAGTLKFRIEL